MNNLQEWAQWYQHMQIWVYPYNQDKKMDDWGYWREIKEDSTYTNLSSKWNWNDTGIKLVVGKKGIRCLLLKRYYSRDKDKIISKILEYLNLPSDYSWITENDGCMCIIVDTPNISPKTKGLSNIEFNELKLLWQGGIIMPPSNGVVRFYKNRSPKVHPTQISDDILLDSIESIVQYMKSTYKDSTKIELWKTVRYYTIGIVLFLLLIALTGLLPTALVVFLWINWDKLFGKKEKGKED